MMTTEAPTLCPQCKEPAEAPRTEHESIRHCPSCKLPLVVVAGKYEVRHLLSEGGCGILYIAHHQRLQMDPVRVIKFIKPEFCTNEKTIKRLEREVEVTAALSQKNEHIVRVFDDFGKINTLGSYYIMEYLEGEDLADLLDRTPQMSYKKIFHIFKQICKGMRDAHIGNVVHRDLKPQNIFLTNRADDDLFVKIIDFGIAKSVGGQEQTKLTQGALGTPEYMAPEQVQGKEISARTDVYAMGIILYELVVGHTPFLTPAEQNPNPTQIALAHLMKAPPPPSTMTKRDVPQALERLILKCIFKDPDDRFSSAGELLKAIENLDEDLEKAKQRAVFLEASDEGETVRAKSEDLIGGWSPKNEPLPSVELDEPILKPTLDEPILKPTQAAQKPHKAKAQKSPPTPKRTGTLKEVQASKKKTLVLLVVAVLSACILGFALWSKLNPKPITTPNPKRHLTQAPTKRPKAHIQQPVPPRQRKKITPIIPKRRASKVTKKKRPKWRARRTRKRARKRARKRTRKRPKHRRTRPRPSAKISTPGCPADIPGKVWVRMDVSPIFTRLKRTSRMRPFNRPRRLCYLKKINQKISGLRFQAPGFHSCILYNLRTKSNQIKIRLKPKKDGQMMGAMVSKAFNYCVRQ